MKPVEVIRPASFIIGASAPNPTAFTPFRICLPAGRQIPGPAGPLMRAW